MPENRYFCNRCGSYQEFTVCRGMSRAGDRGFCETTVWSCKNCGLSPFLPPKPEKEEKDAGNKSNS